MPNNLDFLIKYIKFDAKFVVRVAEIVLENNSAQDLAWFFSAITNPYTEINKKLKEVFNENTETLKRIYFSVKSGEKHSDYKSTTLMKLVEMDSSFITEYIEWIYESEEKRSRWLHETQDYSILWQQRDYQDIIKGVINLIYEKEKKLHLFIYTGLRHFFILKKKEQLDIDIKYRQDNILTELINTHYQDIDYIKFLFDVISLFSRERRFKFINSFLHKNKNFSSFANLSLEPNSMSWSGSAVPILQEQIDFFITLLPILNTADFLEHRSYIEQKISSLKHRQNIEKKRDFIGE